MKKILGTTVIALAMACVWANGYVKGFKQCGIDIGDNWPLPDDMECAPIMHRFGPVRVGISKEKVEH